MGLVIGLVLVVPCRVEGLPLASGLVDRMPELVVFLGAARQTPGIEDVVARVNDHRPLPGLLGHGGPLAARFVLPLRATGETLAWLRAHPESPRAQIERALVLGYPFGTDIESVRQVLIADPDVENAAENQEVPFSVSPSDPLFAPAASAPQYQWGPYLLNLPLAWDRVKGSASIGDLDNGLQANHPDLQAFSSTGNFQGGNYRPHLSWDFVYKDADADELQNGLGILLTSAAGHGTHVSGILAAATNNARGVAGTCWNCSLLMAKAKTDADLVAGMTWLIDHGVEVINISRGKTPPNANPCSPPPPQNPELLCFALAFADERGVTVAAASGNAKTDIDFPAQDSRVLAVGGIRSDGAFWEESCTGDLCGSNYTKTPGTRMQDLVAPAKDVLSTVYTGRDWITSPIVCGDGTVVDGYGLCTGTSMAAPFVSGIAALVVSANPLLSRWDVRRLLLDNASRSTFWDPKYGYGVPNTAASITKALGTSGGQVIANRLTPLFSLYSQSGQDFLYTVFPQVASAAIFGQLDEVCRARRQPTDSCSVATTYSPAGPSVPGPPQFPGYPSVIPRASVYVFTSQVPPYSGAPPLVPLYRMSYNPQRINPSSTSTDRDTTYTTDSTGLKSFRSVGYELDGIEGYIYQRCTPEPSCIPPGAVRLYRLYNAARDDYAIFPESELGQMQAAGYASSPGLNDWIGYVYPNVDQDGDQLIDGFERLLGTNPAWPDSDCDGRTDGAEVLQFPNSDPRSAPGCL